MSGILHNQLLLYLGNWMIILPLSFIVNSSALNSAVNIASDSFPIDTSEICVRLGMIYPSHVSSGNYGKYSRHSLLD